MNKAGDLELRATQETYIEFRDVLNALGRLVPKQREAMILIVAEGLSFEEAAAVCNCPVGTVKSRFSRARRHLIEYANGESPLPEQAEYGPCPCFRVRSGNARAARRGKLNLD